MAGKTEWVTLQISREYLGKTDDRGVHVKLPGGWMAGWYITVPYKLVRNDESNDWFTFATKPDFEYRTVRYGHDGVKVATGKCKGDLVMKLFENVAKKDAENT